WDMFLELGALETHFSLVPIHQGRPDWNCQTWVVEALRGLNQSHLWDVGDAYVGSSHLEGTKNDEDTFD
ncbi:hypothetical protein EV363DRAFT_1181635, partial [Boletus edulis]